jgi:hypothetical protein
MHAILVTVHVVICGCGNRSPAPTPNKLVEGLRKVPELATPRKEHVLRGQWRFTVSDPIVLVLMLMLVLYTCKASPVPMYFYGKAVTQPSVLCAERIQEDNEDGELGDEVEEKEDLWKLWNAVRQDGDQRDPLLATASGRMGAAKASFNDKHVLLKRDSADRSPLDNSNSRSKHSYAPSGPSIAESTRSIDSVPGSGSKHTAYKPLPYESLSRPAVNNNTFELSGNGKFGSPEARTKAAAPAAPATYTYNNSTYNIVGSPPAAGSANKQRLPASPTRYGPGVSCVGVLLVRLRFAPCCCMHGVPPPVGRAARISPACMSVCARLGKPSTCRVAEFERCSTLCGVDFHANTECSPRRWI